MVEELQFCLLTSHIVPLMECVRTQHHRRSSKFFTKVDDFFQSHTLLTTLSESWQNTRTQSDFFSQILFSETIVV